ncbi:MAG: hypothetical protein CK429_28805 [Mycobacterium sp.]|nr:MAG: hypothetical protein CK429_28805 [Mycobacterium sp.]PJE17291.1 MAG: hypothetical protein CK428_00910 [Mycobacterium sp.]
MALDGFLDLDPVAAGAEADQHSGQPVLNRVAHRRIQCIAGALLLRQRVAGVVVVVADANVEKRGGLGDQLSDVGFDGLPARHEIDERVAGLGMIARSEFRARHS